MSVASQITRLTGLRDRLRTKLVSLGLVSGSAKLADCTDAVEEITAKAGQTYTPGTQDQVISAGQYLTGAQTVKGDSNLIADNIAEGVTVFGIVGTHVGGGGADEINALIQDTISGDYVNSTVSIVGSGAFMGCTGLKTASFPACTTISNSAFAYCRSLNAVSIPMCVNIGGYAFLFCSSLSTASFSVCTSISNSAFCSCFSLSTVSFPVCKTVNSYAFAYCSILKTASFPACKLISASAFYFCSSLATASFPKLVSIYGCAFMHAHHLVSFYLTGSSICTLSNSNAFNSTPIGGYSASAKKYGSIYVPASLLTSYKAATNWTYFSSRFVGA